MLGFVVEKFFTCMDPSFFKPIHKELQERFGEDYKAMADRLWSHSCLADAGLKPDAEVAASFTGPIQEDVLYRFFRELAITDLNKAEKHVVDNLNALQHDYVRAVYRYREAKGEIQYPDANSTMRL